MKGKLMSLVCMTGILSACQSASDKPLALAPQLDVPRYMGSWYVIANIPTFLEKGAHNAVERYELDKDGSIATTFTFRKDGFDGEEKRYTSRGFVSAENPAIWGMQYLWPVKADYRISFIAPDYSTVVVTREKRDYVWIMARTPQIPEADYEKLARFVGEQGYDVGKLQRVPQKW